MKVKFIPGPEAEKKKQQAQSYIKKRSVEIYLNQKKKSNNPDPAA